MRFTGALNRCRLTILTCFDAKLMTAWRSVLTLDFGSPNIQKTPKLAGFGPPGHSVREGVHDIAFTNGLGPRMHHIAFWVPTPLNIIDLLDLMATTGYVGNIERGPGRHGISNAFFLYVLDPDGHRIEIYCSDYQTIDPDHEPIKWDLKDPQRQTLWGAPAPQSWFEHGTPFEGADPYPSDLKAQPIIAP